MTQKNFELNNRSNPDFCFKKQNEFGDSLCVALLCSFWCVLFLFFLLRFFASTTMTLVFCDARLWSAERIGCAFLCSLFFLLSVSKRRALPSSGRCARATSVAASTLLPQRTHVSLPVCAALWRPLALHFRFGFLLTTTLLWRTVARRRMWQVVAATAIVKLNVPLRAPTLVPTPIRRSTAS